MSDGPLIWSHLNADEVGAAARDGRVAVLPIGATEQHGPHLATGTDWLLAEGASTAASSVTGDIVLPTLNLGCSLGHTDHWPGTISLSPAILTRVVEEVGWWVHASGFRHLVLVNGHGTNGPPCQSAILQLRFDLPDLLVRFVSLHEMTPAITERYLVDGEDIHANATETAVMLHLHPEMVEMARAVDEEDRTIGRVFPYAMPAVTASGVVGTPTQARVESGAETFSMVVDALSELLRSARRETPPLS
jgi:creatinine amidohydrolase